MKKNTAQTLISDWTKTKQTWITVESATGGAIAAELTSVPGASKVFAGSLVVYQSRMKSFWLDVDPSLYAEESSGGVGLDLTEALAESALTQSPQVDGVLAITGHFGPGAPKALDGKIYLAVAMRDKKSKKGTSVSTQVQEVKLTEKARDKRRKEAVSLALRFLSDSLAS